MDIPLAPAPSGAELEKMTAKDSPSWQSRMATAMLQSLEKGQKLPTHYRAPIAVWQFGSDLTLVALSGEAVVDYAQLIERAIGPAQLWLSAYNNDVFGCLPSAKVLEEGGYETRGVVHGGPGFLLSRPAGHCRGDREGAGCQGRTARASTVTILR